MASLSANPSTNSRGAWRVSASPALLRSHNPIRDVLEALPPLPLPQPHASSCISNGYPAAQDLEHDKKQQQCPRVEPQLASDTQASPPPPPPRAPCCHGDVDCGEEASKKATPAAAFPIMRQTIPLGQGDPAAFQFLRAPDSAELALIDAIRSGKHNGYTHSAGLPECRRAVAEYHSHGSPVRLGDDDVIITVGCTQAIQFSLAALATPGSNILLPRPGFPLYETFCSFYGIKVRHYDLLPEHDWEIDLEQLDMLTDRNTVALVICNPSNPCGASYSFEHLSKVVKIAERLRLPIIADEIYGHMVFDKHPFVPMATFSKRVPVLTLGGLSKRWLVPGWRVGWIAICDPHGILMKARVVEALLKIAQMTVNTTTIVQAAVPSILQDTPNEFFEQTLQLLQHGANLCYRRIQGIDGLDCPSKPTGSMFIMVRINMSLFTDFSNDLEFASALAREESVIVLPGTAFGTPNWMRLIFAAPSPLLEEAWDRIESFCVRHRKLTHS